jgi:hypothetical protein
VRRHQPRAADFKPQRRLSQISAPRQAMLRVFQGVDYGQILDLLVRDREPMFSPPPTLLLDIKLDAESGSRPELALADFDLSEEVCRLLDRLDQMENGRIQRIEVRAGIPRRILIEARVPECLP